jgi:hypothetical protein
MAWQLIYSSAPRLLDAGLTGFGTVARHRAIPPLVVKAVERISQFARLPGYPADRIIFSHRVLTVGGARFHVLSRLRDAGSDYSGRTNHIAHHLVVAAQETAQLAPGAATPADILLQMAWLDRWDKGPEWLDDERLVPLQRFVRANGSDRAWESVTGDAESRWLLVNGKTARSACLIHPTGTDPLPLITASQHAQQTADAWQSAFTTALQPTDEAQEFRWIGLAADSPLRGPMETSGRPLLDLNNPAALPTPQLPAAPAAPSPAAPGHPATSASVPSHRYTPPPPTARPASPPDTPSPPHSRTRNSLSTSSPRRANRFLIPALIGVTATAAGIAAFLWFNRPQVPPSVPAQNMNFTALFEQVDKAKTLDELRKITLPKEHNSARLDLIQRIQERSKSGTIQTPLSVLKDLFENKENYKNENPNYVYGKDSVRKILEKAALDSLEQARPTDSTVIHQVKQHEWMSPEHQTRAIALTRPPEPAATVPSTPAPPAVATAPTPPPDPTPAPQPITSIQRSIVDSFAELGSFAGPDKSFWEEWKSNVAIIRNGKRTELDAQDGVLQDGGTRFVEAGKEAKTILSINGSELKVFDTADGEIEAIILTKDRTSWEITTKTPAATKLPAAENLTWNPGKDTFTFTGKAKETLTVFRLHDKQSLQFILDRPDLPADLPAIVIKGSKPDPLPPYLKDIRDKAKATPENDPAIKKLQEDLTKIEEKKSKVNELDSLRAQLESANQAKKKDSQAIRKLAERIEKIKQTSSLLPLDGTGQNEAEKFKSRIQAARDDLAKKQTEITEKQAALRAPLEKAIGDAKAVAAEFETKLPYGGGGKVYLVTGGGRAGSKGSHLLLTITEP